MSGTIEFDGCSEVYGLVTDGWRGDYHRVSETFIYQDPAVASTRAKRFL
jgi:hypothetical protein